MQTEPNTRAKRVLSQGLPSAFGAFPTLRASRGSHSGYPLVTMRIDTRICRIYLSARKVTARRELALDCRAFDELHLPRAPSRVHGFVTPWPILVILKKRNWLRVTVKARSVENSLRKARVMRSIL